MDKLLAKIAELEAMISKAEGAKKVELEGELGKAKTELSAMSSRLVELEAKNKELEKKQIELEVAGLVKDGLPESKVELAKFLITSGKAADVKMLFEKADPRVAGKKPEGLRVINLEQKHEADTTVIPYSTFSDMPR